MNCQASIVAVPCQCLHSLPRADKVDTCTRSSGWTLSVSLPFGNLPRCWEAGGGGATREKVSDEAFA